MNPQTHHFVIYSSIEVTEFKNGLVSILSSAEKGHSNSF